MFIKWLELVNFRNYGHVRIEFPTMKTILIGKNAQGKSNLLESIYYLSTLKSNRASTDSELILWNNDYAKIKAEIEKNETQVNLEVLINPPKKKVLKVNGLKKTSYSQFLGNLSVVNFGVSDLLLLRGAPSDRRNWLDSAIGQIYPAYVERLSKFNKIRIQRNNLLKEFKGSTYLNEFQKDLLSVWDEQLVISGSNLIYLRQKYLKEIQTRAAEKHRSISSGENLLVEYFSTVTGVFNSLTDESIPVEEIAKKYESILLEKRNEEIIRTQTLIGPHRDDVSFYINDIDAKSYASQGQQRTIVLSLKLAELDFIKSVIGENPVLLLDDVLAELDQSRQNFLLYSIGEDVQTVITSVDILNFEPDFLKDVKVYYIEAGNIIKDHQGEY